MLKSDSIDVHSAKPADDTKISFISNNKKYMLTTIAIILLVLWLLGIVTSVGNFIHILLVIAIIIILVRLIKGEKPF